MSVSALDSKEKTVKDPPQGGSSLFLSSNWASWFSSPIEYRRLKPRPRDVPVSHVLAYGATSIVYKAEYKGEKIVAVKLYPHRTEQERDYKHEQNVLVHLSHPNIVKTFGPFAVPSTTPLYGMVMECAERRSLHYSLRNQDDAPMHVFWDRYLLVALCAAKGLCYLHSLCFIHRDVKSRNIMIRLDWSAFIIDFGLAIRVEDLDATVPGACENGTYAWMAPELFREGPFVPRLTDVYAFGMVMYEMATRTEPFHGKGEYAIIQSLVKGMRPTLPEQDYPKGFVELMKECWDEQPSKRPQNFNEIVKRLEQIKETHEASYMASSSTSSSSTSSSSSPSSSSSSSSSSASSASSLASSSSS
jgi:serine/threonine protein kinase